MDIVFSVLLVAHFIGLAAIIGPFLVHMRANGGFSIAAVFGGAITQLVTGVAMTGLAEALGYDLDYPKIITKLVITIIIFVAALIGWLRARRGRNDRSIKPFFHAAGGLAVVNVIIAVFW
jgi:multisubunit Na+/H+ antiporter MnhB subunit